MNIDQQVDDMRAVFDFPPREPVKADDGCCDVVMIVVMSPCFLASVHLGYTTALGWLCATVLLPASAYPMTSSVYVFAW